MDGTSTPAPKTARAAFASVAVAYAIGWGAIGWAMYTTHRRDQESTVLAAAGIASFVTNVIAVGIGRAALKQGERVTPRPPRGLATASIVLAVVGFIGSALLLLVALVDAAAWH